MELAPISSCKRPDKIKELKSSNLIAAYSEMFDNQLAFLCLEV